MTIVGVVKRFAKLGQTLKLTINLITTLKLNLNLRQMGMSQNMIVNLFITIILDEYLYPIQIQVLHRLVAYIHLLSKTYRVIWISYILTLAPTAVV